MIYREDGARLYLIGAEEGYILHAEVDGEITHNRLKHFDKIFIATLAGLMERGIKTIKAWVEESQINFAKYFGFEDMHTLRILVRPDGERVALYEMHYTIPEFDDEENA